MMLKKSFILIIALMLLLSLCGCDRFEDTPATDAAFDAYEAAVAQSITHNKGEITVVTENTDTVIDNKKTLGVIEYSYQLDDEKNVIFERNDFTDDKLVASYYSKDGKSAYQMNFESGDWEDVTEDSRQMLKHETNIFNNLSLFRIDNNFRYSKRFYESVEMKEAEGEKVITFKLKNSAVTDMLAFADKREIRREMSAQSRSYYVNEKGDLYKIVIDTVQDITYKQDKGRLSTLLTVHINY